MESPWTVTGGLNEVYKLESSIKLLATVTVKGETWRIVKRSMMTGQTCGIRILHGAYVEWPILLPNGCIRFASHDGNGERSERGAVIPSEVIAEVTRIMRSPAR
jgi:hypothetical protein